MGNCDLFNFVVWGVIGSALCAFGYIGNLLSVFALQRDIRTPTTTLLQSLAVSDLVLLLSTCITDAVPYICVYTAACSSPWVVWPSIRYIWMLTPVSHMCSIWLVVLVSGNRYWAVCRPHSTGVVWTNRRTWVYVVCVVVLVVAFNMPRLFEYGFREECAGTVTTTVAATTRYSNRSADPARGLNLTSAARLAYETHKRATTAAWMLTTSGDLNDFNVTRCRIIEVKSAFGMVDSYRVVYKVMLVNILLVLLPIAFLLVSSIWIVRTLRLSHHMSTIKHRARSPSNNHVLVNGSVVPPSTGDAPAGRRSRLESLLGGEQAPPVAFSKRTTPSREVTFLLVTVVLVAVFCQTPLVAFHFVRYAHSYNCGDTVYYLESFSKFLVNLNSCVNFVIYCLLSPKFRRMLRDALTCRGRPGVKGRPSNHQPSRVQFEFSVRESVKRRVT